MQYSIVQPAYMNQLKFESNIYMTQKLIKKTSTFYYKTFQSYMNQTAKWLKNCQTKMCHKILISFKIKLKWFERNQLLRLGLMCINGFYIDMTWVWAYIMVVVFSWHILS